MKKYLHAPDAKTASRLLGDLAVRPVLCGPRKVDKPLVLYGAGNLGKMAKEYFGRLDIHFQYVLDVKPHLYRDDPFWKGINIVSPQEVPVEQRKHILLAVCVATVPFSEVSATLIEEGWQDVVPFYDIAESYRDQHPLSNGWFTGWLDEEDIKNIEETFSRWVDDISRAHHLQFIAWHHLREDWIFNDAPVTNDRYFVPQVLSLLRDDEVFVDVGAHHAEVSLKFIQSVGGRFKELWLIEPDLDNIREIRTGLQLMNIAENSGIHLLTCAVSAEEGCRNFSQGLGYASQMCEFAKDRVEVRTIDQLAIAPSLIKFHLEGGELDALRGSLKTIEKYRPIIAVTTYHNRLGLWELPKWLMDNLSDYIFLLRLHSWCGTGSVVYCIPMERSRNVAVTPKIKWNS